MRKSEEDLEGLEKCETVVVGGTLCLQIRWPMGPKSFGLDRWFDSLVKVMEMHLDLAVCYGEH